MFVSVSYIFTFPLFCVQRACLLLLIYLNTTSLVVFTVRERSLPTSLGLWGSEPESEKVAPWGWWEIVGVGCTRVEDVG